MSIYIFNMHHSKWQPKYKVFSLNVSFSNVLSAHSADTGTYLLVLDVVTKLSSNLELLEWWYCDSFSMSIQRKLIIDNNKTDNIAGHDDGLNII